VNEIHTVQDGSATYARHGWNATYVYTDGDETFDTGARDMVEARRIVFERHQATRRAARAAGEVVPTYTVTPGSRARAGHQRHRYRDGEIVVPDAQTA